MFSQNAISSVSYTQEELNNKPRAKKGTYQFIVSNTKLKYYFTDETFILIEDKRLETEDVSLYLNQFTTVFIPSRKKINLKDYQFLPEYFYQ